MHDESSVANPTGFVPVRRGHAMSWAAYKLSCLFYTGHFCLWVHVCTGPEHLGIWYHITLETNL